jgi:hypothetical protein
MSGIGLQQSIAMARNNSLGESLREWQNSHAQWVHHAEVLEKKLKLAEAKINTANAKLDTQLAKVDYLETALKGSEKRLEAANYYLEAANIRRDAEEEYSKAVKKRHDKLDTQFKAYKERANTLLDKVSEEDYELKGLLLEHCDRISTIRHREKKYHAYVEDLLSGIEYAGTQSERMKTLVKVLSGYDVLMRSYLAKGFNFERIKPSSREDLEMAFKHIEDEDVRNALAERLTENATKIEFTLEEGKRPQRIVSGYIRGFSRDLGDNTTFGRPDHFADITEPATGDVFDPERAYYYGFSRAGNSVVVSTADIRHMCMSAVAWSEYMQFLTSHKDSGFLEVVQSNEIQKMAYVNQLLTDDLSDDERQSILLNLKTLIEDQQRMQQAKARLLANATVFVDNRIRELMNVMQFQRDVDMKHEHEWQIMLDSIPPATMKWEEAGQTVEVVLLDLSVAEKQSMLDTFGVTEMTEHFNLFYTDSEHDSQKFYTLEDGSILEVTHETRPKFDAHLSFKDNLEKQLQDGTFEVAKDGINKTLEIANRPRKFGVDLDLF